MTLFQQCAWWVDWESSSMIRFPHIAPEPSNQTMYSMRDTATEKGKLLNQAIGPRSCVLRVLERGGFPYLYRVIYTSRGNTLAIRRPCQRLYADGMPAKGVGMPGIRNVNHIYCRVKRSCRGEVFAIRRPCYCVQHVSRPGPGINRTPRCRLPYPHFSGAAKSKILAVG